MLDLELDVAAVGAARVLDRLIEQAKRVVDAKPEGSGARGHAHGQQAVGGARAAARLPVRRATRAQAQLAAEWQFGQKEGEKKGRARTAA